MLISAGGSVYTIDINTIDYGIGHDAVTFKIDCIVNKSYIVGAATTKPRHVFSSEISNTALKMSVNQSIMAAIINALTEYHRK